mmetsp:Transcript_41670/g.105073  ORF Transcript_41670/g.105073 Transcript_41670/m.105073 type:complete len:81 (+) Transcript_41670:342-584(+)
MAWEHVPLAQKKDFINTVYDDMATTQLGMSLSDATAASKHLLHPDAVYPSALDIVRTEESHLQNPCTATTKEPLQSLKTH